jgi:hypothetical protein
MNAKTVKPETLPVPATTPDILDIDPVSFATAVGHAAAARFASIMLTDRAPDFWFWPGAADDAVASDEAEKIIADLGGYVCSRRELVSGETLYRKASELGVCELSRWEFMKLVPHWHYAWSLFANTVFNVHQDMNHMQTVERARRDEAEAIPPAPVFLGDDDAFEEHDSVDELENLSGKPKKKRPAKKTGSKQP